jgi:hypothetical protein
MIETNQQLYRPITGTFSFFRDRSADEPEPLAMVSRFKFWVVVLCVAMVLCTGVAEASHFHSDEQSSHPASKKTTACVICHIAHCPAVAVSVVLICHPFAPALPVAAFLPSKRIHLEAFGLSVRPPPVTC